MAETTEKRMTTEEFNEALKFCHLVDTSIDLDVAILQVAHHIEVQKEIESSMGCPGGLSNAEWAHLNADEALIYRIGPKYSSFKGMSMLSASALARTIVDFQKRGKMKYLNLMTGEYKVLIEKEVPSEEYLNSLELYKKAKEMFPSLVILEPRITYTKVEMIEEGCIYSENQLPF